LINVSFSDRDVEERGWINMREDVALLDSIKTGSSKPSGSARPNDTRRGTLENIHHDVYPSSLW
jgi:hypothetical protein